MIEIDFPASGETSSSSGNNYFENSRRPLAGLCFLLPILAIYEIGALSFGEAPALSRNGVDCWMRNWLLHVGLAHHWVLPLLVLAVMVVWHLQSGDRWRFSFDTFGGMFGESLLIAVGLVIFGQLLSAGFHMNGLETVSISSLSIGSQQALAAGQSTSAPGYGSRLVSFLGAGIYEEVLFRLTAIPLVFYLLRGVLVPRVAAGVVAVVSTSLLFALAHYVGGSQGAVTMSGMVDVMWSIADDSSLWYGFTFRCCAGLLFATLFVTRGFGITVGVHAIYDLLVGIAMQA